MADYKLQPNLHGVLIFLTKTYLDVSDDLSLSSCHEGVAPLSKEFHEIVSDVTSCQVKARDGMRKSITWG